MPFPQTLSLSSSSSLFFSPSSSFKPPKTLKPIPNFTTPTTIRSELSPSPTTLPVLSFTGTKTGEALLSLKSAPTSTSTSVVHRALVAHLQNLRRGTASTLTRAEVRGGGRKPYPQKKTGGARRGSSRTPLRPGGGVVFGPKPRDWSIKINRKEKQLALSTAIESAAAAEDAFVVEDFEGEFEERAKTREFVEAMRRWGLDPKRKCVFFMMEVSENVRLASRNVGTVKILTPRTVNLFDVLDAEKIVFTRAAVDYLNEVYGEDGGGEDAEEGFEILEGDEEGTDESSS